jgi:hypothetical protein
MKKHNLEILNLDNITKIYKTKIEYDKVSLIKELILNTEISFDTTINTIDVSKLQSPIIIQPGIQSPIIINSHNIQKILNFAVNKLKNQFNIDKNEPYLLDGWIYQSKNNNTLTLYHNHITNTLKKQIDSLQNDWSFVFYVQMPNNLKNDDGHLYFKSKSGIEYSILPEEGDLFIFPADLQHKPATNTNSTLDRFVIAANYMRLPINNKYIKKEKTLF